jgi:16S rRNA processing protein RimM
LIVRFKGLATREQAQTLGGTALFVDRSMLPPDLEDDEFYHADLIGLAVRDENGTKIGTIIGIHDFGAGDILEVRRKGGPSVMVPFTRAAVPRVAPAQGFVQIDNLLAGLAGEEAPPENAAARGGGKAGRP